MEIFLGAGDAWEIDNYGEIYGVAAKAVNIRGGNNTKNHKSIRC